MSVMSERTGPEEETDKTGLRRSERARREDMAESSVGDTAVVAVGIYRSRRLTSPSRLHGLPSGEREQVSRYGAPAPALAIVRVAARRGQVTSVSG